MNFILFRKLGLGIIFGGLAVSSSAYAHGEDKMGPHDGFIRMPGGFHTELKIQGSSLNIYLLDINWKNPTVDKSSIEAKYLKGKNVFNLSCASKEDHFSCRPPKGFNEKAGKIVIVAERQGMKGGPAEYDLPLKLQNQADDHSAHH